MKKIKSFFCRSKKRNVRMTNSFSSLSFEGLEMEGIVSVRRPGSEARPLVGGDRLTTVPTRTDPSPALIALSNWEFIEILLKVRFNSLSSYKTV